MAVEPDWSAYRAVLSHVKPGEKHCVELMRVDYPAIKADGSLFKPVWDRPAGQLGGKEVTLGEVEHNISGPAGAGRALQCRQAGLAIG